MNIWFFLISTNRRQNILSTEIVSLIVYPPEDVLCLNVENNSSLKLIVECAHDLSPFGRDPACLVVVCRL